MSIRHKNLYRSNTNYRLAGVCGGIADYLSIDATLVRLAWIMATFFGGSGVVAYLIAWVIMPLRTNREEEFIDPNVII